ncbi:CDK-activating kinase assembly factor MAT1 isoform X2 [Malaclemys terrapin pileata]|uniref:CDK-activating kinase assembly factor MAT1 isoform X2 n=1 Tax=Malaclemys terrapin pileata TaxID=2991368 RepID=UPI0023A7A6AE|nr:CDK-activating kinase assembly factor MAT1 isoform X2 [Malaclemys terrapin pileata]
MVELRILTEGKKESSRIRTLNFRKADFDSFRELMGKISWEANMRGKGVQESWLYFKKAELRAQEQTIPMCRKNSKYGRRPAWLNRDNFVFNLTNNVDLENTKKKMDMYQKDNKEVIQKNKIKLTREQEELEEALEVERQENEQRRLFIQKEEQMQQIIKRKNKQALLDELESSHLPASLLLAQHKDRSTQLEMQLEKPRPVKPVTFSTGIKMSQHISLAPIQKLEEALYEYQPLQVETYGPQVPETELLGRLGYLNHVRATSPQDLAGGYTSSLACHRALQDAFSGLFWHPS